MSRKRLLRLTSSICLILLLAALLLPACSKGAAPTTSASPTPTTQVFKWRMQVHLTPGDFRYDVQHSTEWPRLVKERTNGRIEITPYPPGALAKVDDMLDACGNGLFEMMTGFGGYWQGKVPIGEVEGGPSMGWSNTFDALSCFWDRGLEDLAREAYKPFNVYYLTPLVGSDEEMGVGFLSKVDVPNMAASKGIKLRAPGGWSRWFESMGFSVTFLPMGEIYMALQLGTVDAAYTSWSSLYGMKCYEVTKYMFPVKQASADHYMINLNIWNSVPKELQQTLTATGREFCSWYSRGQQTDASKCKKLLLQKGIKEIVWPAADLVKAQELAQLTWDDIAKKDAYCAKGIQILKDYRAAKAAGFPAK